MQVQVLSPAPNKADSFDTRVSETVSLILLPKILAGQGFSAFFVLRDSFIVVLSPVFYCPGGQFFRTNENHAETFLRGIVSAWL